MRMSTLLSFSTVGEALLDTRRQVSTNEDEVRSLLDFYGSTEGLSDSDMRRLREQHLDLYNLMGGPASPLRLPPGRVELVVEGESYDGSLKVYAYDDAQDAIGAAAVR